MPTLKKISCLAVDDEPPALDVLENHIRCVPALTLVGTCNNALEAIEKLQVQPVSLIFLDIQMPQILGTDFVRTLKNPPKVIFTTAYRKFAVEGFELNAVDYLLKPISFERFLRAVNKVMDTSLVPTESASSYENVREPAPEFLYFRSNRKMVKVSVNEVLYIESLKDYIKVITPSKTIIAKQSMTSLEESLPRENFIRIHRSFIISLNKIESYNSEMVEVGKKELPISRFYKHEVDKVLNIEKR